MRTSWAACILSLNGALVTWASPGLFSIESQQNNILDWTANADSSASSSRLSDVDTIRGVNIGGVFLIEPFIRPSLFDQFNISTTSELPVDEWTFSAALGKNETRRQLEEHWDTFVTKKHLELLASYGINWIRIPIGYWAFNLTDDEPFVNGQLPYVERLLDWAREVGLKVELDLHGAPGSQNGYDNSGHRVTPEWLYSRANVDRTLDALKKMTEIAVKWDDVVYGIQILNEPSRWKWPISDILEFYNEAYNVIRGMTDDVYVMIHDTFLGPNEWRSLVNPNWKNVLMDTHIYQMFDNYMITMNDTAHIDMITDMSKDIVNFNSTNIGVVVGEFSAATHDCTKYINGFGTGNRWEGTLNHVDHPLCPFDNCTCTGDYSSNYTQFSTHYKRFLKSYVEAQFSVYDGLAGWFYWNFKTESAPEWDYLLGVEQGWIPKFPRTAMPRKNDENLEVSAVDLVSTATTSIINLSFVLISIAAVTL